MDSEEGSLVERVAALERTVGELQHTRRSAEARARRWQWAACALAAVGLFLLPLQNSVAQLLRPGGSAAIRRLRERVRDLEGRADEQAAQIVALQTALAGEVATRAATDAGLQGQITPLSDLFLAPNPVDGEPFFQRIGTDILVTGANLRLRNGLGATNGNPADPSAVDPGLTAVNGLGNLIVGYDENPDGSLRTGSHNLVVGNRHGWASFGGLVAGQANHISGPFASVSGGFSNTASGLRSSVSGGNDNIASGQEASVGGGTRNAAGGHIAWASGGFLNDARGDQASVSGGFQNIASGLNASVSGGNSNTASGDFASVSGGAGITQGSPIGWSAGSAVGVGFVGDFRSP